MRSPKKIPVKFWVVLICCVIIVIVSYLRPFDSYELITYDLRFKLRPPLEASRDILIIEISDDTLNNLNAWPLPRDFHASLLDVLKRLGARMVVFDVLFSEPTLYDDVFANAIKNSGNVYLPFACKGFPETKTIIADICDGLKESAAGIGHINVSVDSDGKVRRIPLFIKHKDSFLPHLALKAASDWLGHEPSLPVLPDGSFLVNYPDKWDMSFKHLSYFDILRSYMDRERGAPPQIDLSIIKDKICFIGLTAAGASDLKPMPLENIYPMLGLQASVFNSIINQEFIRDAGAPLNTFINLLIFILSLMICLRFHAIKALVGNTILGLVYFVIATLLFMFYGLWINLFLPILVIGLTYISATVYRFLDEAKKRELLEKELDIAREIQKSFLPEEIKGFRGIEISAFLQPAKFVAGDLYDIFALDDKRLGVFIGDVSGKGVPASLIMAQTISVFRLFSRQYPTCCEVLQRLNKELYGRFAGRFVTCLYMIIDVEEKKVRVSSAGHSPVLVHKNTSDSILDMDLAADMPLGIMEDVEYKDVVFDLEKGDEIIIFTDGVTEARNKCGQEFDLEIVKNLISKDKDIKDGLFKFCHRATQHDDITLITLKNSLQ
ncbi:MAG: CHASE2 domain-containing protein [Candidatus Omnitrophica bacterium]|nr:CHASE2 domain-containing protein [Candidatus Omnitrophota bacterium]